jgi:hypothetical protein
VSTTTYSERHLVPDGRAMLACSCELPDAWVQIPTPDEHYDFDNPAVFLPIVVCMAPYGAIVFTIAARPAFEDGTVQDWAEYLAAQNGLTIQSIREARVNHMPCVLVDATMPSELGAMRSRSLFLEDGKRLYNIGALAPEPLWASVEADFTYMFGTFRLDETRGITAAPLRLMTSNTVIDLAANVAAIKAARAQAEAPPPVVERRPDPPVFIDYEPPNEPALRVEPAPDPEFAGQPDWWRDAVLLERADKLEEAEQLILKSVNHNGVFSSVAHMYELRFARLNTEGRAQDALAARDRALDWLDVYASSATSGGEGTAFSRERDERRRALGVEASGR